MERITFLWGFCVIEWPKFRLICAQNRCGSGLKIEGCHLFESFIFCLSASHILHQAKLSSKLCWYYSTPALLA